jgi:hypothetical protein
MKTLSVTDEKFSSITSALLKRHWSHIEESTKSAEETKPPQLIWANLRSVDFHAIADSHSIVNHIRGFQNLSNKVSTFPLQ